MFGPRFSEDWSPAKMSFPWVIYAPFLSGRLESVPRACDSTRLTHDSHLRSSLRAKSAGQYGLSPRLQSGNWLGERRTPECHPASKRQGRDVIVS